MLVLVHPIVLESRQPQNSDILIVTSCIYFCDFSLDVQQQFNIIWLKGSKTDTTM